MARSQVVILAGEDPRGPALTAAMERRRWSVWPPLAGSLGVDSDAALVEALGTCALVVVLSAGELEDRAAVKVAIDGWRNDRSSTRVVPVGDVGAVAALTGLNLLQRCPWTDAEQVAALLDQTLESVGARGEETARVVVISHPTEVREREQILTFVSKRRRVQKPVAVGWVDDPATEALVAGADLVLLVVGLAVAKEAVSRLQRISASAQRFHRQVILTADAVAACGDFLAVMALRGADPGLEGEALVRAVTDALDTWLDQRFHGDGAAGLHPWERVYLDLKRREWTRGHHSGLLAIAGGTALTRAALYVPAKAGPGPWHGKKKKEDAARAEAPAPVWLDALVTRRDLVAVLVEGEAGSGKTVLLQHLGAAVASRALGLSSDEEDHIDEAALAFGAPRLRVPIFLEASRVAARLGVQKAARAIATLIAEEEFSGCGKPRVEEVQQGFEEGRYLLLLDARDEAPAELLATLDAALVQLVAMHPKVRVIVTSRPAAHTATPLGAPFVTVPIAALDDADRAALVQRWCASMPARKDDLHRGLSGTLAELSGKLGDGSDGERSPLDNPLFLTAALLLCELDGQLPEGRADLYDKLVEVLCRPRVPGDLTGAAQERREVAVALALAAQRAGNVALPVQDAFEAVQVARKLATVRDAEHKIDAMAAHTMLWRYEGRPQQRVVRPWHRSFVEHLAASGLALSGRSPGEVATDLREQLQAPTWAGCVRFLPGAFVAVHSDRGVEWIEALAAQAREETQVRRRGHLWALVADAVAEERARCFAGRVGGGSVAARLAGEVAEVFGAEGGDYGWEDRLLLLDGLGRMATAGELGREQPEQGWLVDPRLEDMRFGAGRWVEVDAGDYPLGEREVGGSWPPRGEAIPAFFLLNTPVTVQDYRPFVAAALRPEPEDWLRQIRHPNRPVVGVDWTDAVEFCRWASTHWRLPEGGARVALPTAAMWEAAARGPNGDPYPWGKDEDPGREDTARAAHDWEPEGAGPLQNAPPVGAFPRGDRGRLVDLVGNVWEWTASPWSEDGAADRQSVSDVDMLVDGGVNRRKIRSNAASRVVRGGSWDFNPRYLRAACRLRWLPVYRFVILGFRVCVLREVRR